MKTNLVIDRMFNQMKMIEYILSRVSLMLLTRYLQVDIVEDVLEHLKLKYRF